jgi:beta-N-acetylhexosaminidase
MIRKPKHFFLYLIFTLFLISFQGKNKINRSLQPTFLTGGDIYAQKLLNQMTLEEKIGQFFMLATWSNREEKHQIEIEKAIKEFKIGGLIYFQGDREDLKKSINRFQKISKFPLLIGMDAEWGIAMRLSKENRFPYAYTIGAADDVKVSEKISSMIAQECREIGVHLNFAPVADVNSNPSNPVIGFRSFGEDAENVANHVAASVRGMEKNGIMTSIKHFPGHGDTDKDSHFELPSVSRTIENFKSVDFKPFEAGIKAGASTVMIAHLNIPALDDSGIPSSLSSKIIKNYLKDSLLFKGLVISDALNMKAVADKYGKIDVVVKAFEAGNDILLYPENIAESIQAIANKVKSGEITEKEIDTRCLKVLKAKYHAFHPKELNKNYTKAEIEWAKKEVYEKALTLIKNENNLLPLTDVNQKIAVVSIGSHTSAFKKMIAKYRKVDYFHFYSPEEARERMKGKLEKYDVILTSFHPNTVLSQNKYGMNGNYKNWLNSIPKKVNHAIILFGNPHALNELTEKDKFESLVLAYENHPFTQEQCVQFLFGSIGSSGKLNFNVSEYLKKGDGITLHDAKRLKFSQPEELGISQEKLNKIDDLIQKSIKNEVFPGCQVFVAVDGKIIYNKAFGSKTYENKTDSITLLDVYDVASVTKIVASTLALMRLQSIGKFSVSKKLKDYIPEVTKSSPYGDIKIIDMMTHQAGLASWIPFYKETIKTKDIHSKIYSKTKKTGFEVPVANDLWILNSYSDSIYEKIISKPLSNKKKYEYSDLGYYFVKKIIEKISKQDYDEFIYKQLYFPMGLNNIRFLPMNYFPMERIVPTENDQIFRNQIIKGYVHDPGSAMMGGIGGHAGIFSNAMDLGAIMQLFLNNGTYSNVEYIKPEIVREYTSPQHIGNRRGIGFDRPTSKNKKGPTCNLVSEKSYGHSGFTGTFVWADPVYKINYVFLSNRVYPDAENWKIRDLSIRSEIQKLIYEAVIK